MQKKTSAIELRKQKQQFIASGKLDVGDAIVPIEYDVIRVLENGTLVSLAAIYKIFQIILSRKLYGVVRNTIRHYTFHAMRVET